MNRSAYPTDAEIRATLLTRADEFCRVTKMARSTLGDKAVGDSSFLHRVKKGSGFTIGIYQRVMSYMDRELAKRTKTKWVAS